MEQIVAAGIVTPHMSDATLYAGSATSSKPLPESVEIGAATANPGNADSSAPHADSPVILCSAFFQPLIGTDTSIRVPLLQIASLLCCGRSRHGCCAEQAKSLRASLCWTGYLLARPASLVQPSTCRDQLLRSCWEAPSCSPQPEQ